MTNLEWMIKNEHELVKDSIAINIGVKKGIPDKCTKTFCYDCDFGKSRDCCRDEIMYWLDKEHEPVYKKGDIVVDSNGKLITVTEDYYDGDFIMVSRYVVEQQYNQYKIPITDIKKKVGHIESEVGTNDK